MKLKPRLLAITEMIDKNSVVADIGTDHGYVPVYLIQHQIARKVIAADVNKGPLNSAEAAIKANGLENYIETRLGSGLEVLSPGEVDTVIIAGMGGLLIRDLLAARPDIVQTVQTFILQPMVAQDELRKWLINNNFQIIDERLAKEEHRIYEIIVVRKGHQVISDELYYDIGFKLIENKDPLLREFILKHIKKNKVIIEGLKYQSSAEDHEKRLSCMKKLEKLEEVLQWLNQAEKSST
ncbi:tRNA (adenine22-N1)-methyltransferase [Geosporobacter subterraneus DSM 17957]|uniref:tRNA (Adenine22-N1)-methyltransferase n=1 Tax=Geosporobacter subterraneus DSM 17957 TaxID=1121919 RepID=A0A1M6JKX6_9FIRM|nr:class I SAM-dependent methyltransferase [Geosporobacter subterraneus]SHJ47358.1 tRNA (adenine22-N1)-methyltransferase [Geosporobacter subterraneus DSM 17957]